LEAIPSKLRCELMKAVYVTFSLIMQFIYIPYNPKRSDPEMSIFPPTWEHANQFIQINQMSIWRWKLAFCLRFEDALERVRHNILRIQELVSAKESEKLHCKQKVLVLATGGQGRRTFFQSYLLKEVDREALKASHALPVLQTNVKEELITF
jgi:hypothetical protein